MPIEIRELVIRVSVTEAQPKEQDREAALAALKRDILEACEEKMEEIARRELER